VTARRYTLRSKAFRVLPSRGLKVHQLGGGRFRLDYPEVDVMADLRSRPASASGGVVRAVVGGKPVVARRRRGRVFKLPAGAEIPAGLARDRFGNRTAQPVLIAP
jgi:hypothetical protein